MNKRNFVINPKTGFWGLAQEGYEKELLAVLNDKILPEKNYRGTHSIILNTTKQCNMGCVYCSASGGRSGERMSEEVARKAVDEATTLELTPRIVFHGSEPLLNMPLIRSTVEYGESLPIKVLFYIQSNLTYLTDGILDFVRAHKIGVSTSVDGFREEHNLNRPFRNGSPSYDFVLRNMEKIMEEQVGMSTVTVVTKHNVHRLSEIALDLESRGVTHIQFLPAVKCPQHKEDFQPTNKELIDSYTHLFEQTFERMERGEQKAVVRNIPQLLASLFLRTAVDRCRVCSSADYHPILSIDTNGDVYPCDFFFGRKEYVVGNIMHNSLVSLLNSKKNPRSASINDSSCGSCDIRRICGGGCLADKLFSGDRPYYCETYFAMYDYMVKKMPELKEKGLLPLAVRNL